MPPLPAYPRLFRLFVRLGSLGIPLLALLAFSLCPACFPRREQVRSFNKCLSDSEQGSDVAHALSLSQRSLHIAPIFRLLLKVAVNGTQQCDFFNFCGTFLVPTPGQANRDCTIVHARRSISALASRFVDAVHTGCLVHEAKMSPDAAHGRSFSHSQLSVMAVSSEYLLVLAV